MNPFIHAFAPSILSVNVESIISYLSLGLTIAFFAVIVLLILAFVRGLTQGWRYGTYRFLFFAVLITVCLCTLAPLSRALGGWDLSSMVGAKEISFQVNNGSEDVTIQSTLTSLQATLSDIIGQVLKAYQVNMDPESLNAYAYGLASSVITLALIVLEAVILFVIGQLLCLLFWHLIFKRFTPREKRKKKTLRVVSGFQELILGVVLLSMFLLPFTSLANALSGAFNAKEDETSQKSETKEVTPEVYQQVKQVVDTYDSSLFAKAFFGWTRSSETGSTFDTSLMEFLTKASVSDEESISFVTELRSLAGSAVYAIKGGLFTEDGTMTNASKVAFALSSYAPKAIASLADSTLVRGILPYAMELVAKLPQVATYIQTETDIDYSAYDYGATLKDLAELYASVQESGILEKSVDSEGNLIIMNEPKSFTDTLLSQWSTFQNLFAALDGERLKLFNDLAKSAIWVQITKEYDAAEASGVDIRETSNFGLSDFFPLFEKEELHNEKGEVKAVPEAIKNLSFSEDLLPVFDRLIDVAKVDPSLLPMALMAASDGRVETDELLSLVSIVFQKENLARIEYYLDGYRDPSLNLADDGTDFEPLLAVKNLRYAAPKLFYLVAEQLNNALGLEGEERMSAESLIADYLDESVTPDPSAYLVHEAQSIFGLARPLILSEAGKTLFNDYLSSDTLTGLYFSPLDGSFLGIDKALLEPLTTSLGNLDASKISSYFLPKALQIAVNKNIGSINSALGFGEGEEGISFDFEAQAGKLGSGIASLLEAYIDSQDLVSYLLQQSASIQGVHDAEMLLKGMLRFTVDGTGEKQLGRLLSAFVSNPLLDDANHDNLIKLLSGTFKLAKLGDLTEDLKAVIGDPDFDVEENIVGLVDFLSIVDQENVLEAVLGLTGTDFSSLRSVSFERLFQKLDEIPLISRLLGAMLDGALSSYSDYFAYGDGKTISFRNVESWADEGKAVDALVSFAVEIGDFSKLNIFSGDPDSVESLLKTLSTSKIFYDKGHYILPEFLATKSVDVFASSPNIGAYFIDLGKGDTTDKTAYGDFQNVLLSMDEESMLQEATRFADVLRSLQNLDGTMAFFRQSSKATFDFRTINPYYVDDILVSMSESALFGRIPLTHIYQEASKSLATSGDSFKAFEDANVEYLYNASLSSTDRLSEMRHLSKALERLLDPSFGILEKDTGKLDANAFNDLDRVSARYLVGPVLEELSESKVFNTSKYPATEDPLAARTTFKEIIASFAGNLGFFLSDGVHSAAEVARYAVYSVDDWSKEIESFVSILEDVKDLDLDFANLDFDALFKSDALAENSRVKIENLFDDILSSKLLSQGIPAQLEKTILGLGESLQSVSKAFGYSNFYPEGKVLGYATLSEAPYTAEEANHLSYLVKGGFVLKRELAGASLDIESLTDPMVDSLVTLLSNMGKSTIFNSPKEGESYTAFNEALVALINPEGQEQGYFAKDDAHSAQDVARKAVYAVTNWEEEATSFGEILRSAKAVGLSLKDQFDLGTLFADEATAEEGRVKVASFLESIADSSILSAGLPEKIQGTIASLQGTMTKANIDLSLANPYYVGSVTDYPTLAKGPYDEGEIDNFTQFVKEGYLLGGSLDVSNLAEDKIDRLTEMLASMGKSYVLNSVKDGKDRTLFQEGFGAMFDTETLKSFLYLDYSPKDLHFASEYKDARSKGYYLAKAKIGVLTYPEKGPSTLDTSSINGESDSLRQSLKELLNGGVLEALKKNDLASLPALTLQSAFKALEANPYTVDIVPNAIAVTIKKGSFALDGIAFTRANPFYMYAIDGYDASFPTSEMENASTLLEMLQGDGVKALSSPSAIKDLASLTEIRKVLDVLENSYVFHLAGAAYDLAPDNNPLVFESEDLDVFRQIAYRIYNDSGFGALAYDSVYDGAYANSQAKLLMRVKDLSDELWGEELDNLLVDVAGTKGFVYDAFKSGLFEAGKGIDFSNGSFSFASFAPATVELLSQDLNATRIGRDALLYEVGDLLSTGVGLDGYTTFTRTYQSADIGALLSKIGLPIRSLSFDKEVTVSYEVAGASKSLSGKAISFVSKDLSLPLGSALRYAGDATSVTLTYEVYDLFLDATHYKEGVIPSIRNLLDVLAVTGSDGKTTYKSFSDSESLGNFLADDGSGNFLSLTRFLKKDQGLFKTAFGEDLLPSSATLNFESADIVVSNLFQMEMTMTVNGQKVKRHLNLLSYMPHYSKDGSSLAQALGDIHRFLPEGTDEYGSAVSWLSSHFRQVTYYDLSYEVAGPVGISLAGQSVTLPRIHTLFAFLDKAPYSGAPSFGEYLAEPLTGSVDSFEGAFKAGIAWKLYGETRSYMLAGDYFYGLALQKPSSTADPSLRQKNLPASGKSALDATNAAEFLSLSSKLFDVASTLSLDVTKAKASGSALSWSLTAAEKARIASDLSVFVSYTGNEPFADLAVSVYQGVLYELWVNRNYYHAATSVGAVQIPEVDYIETPFGEGGYFAKAPSALLVSA